MGYYEDEMYLQKMEIDENFSKYEKKKNKSKKTAKIIIIIAAISLIIGLFVPYELPTFRFDGQIEYYYSVALQINKHVNTGSTYQYITLFYVIPIWEQHSGSNW